MGHAETTVLAVVVDPGRLAAGIVDQRGEVLVRDRIGTPTREVWRTLEQLVLRVLAARPDEVARPTVVAVSCAGPIDEPAGSVSPAALPAWSGFPLRDHVEQLTGLPVVLDTLAGAVAEGELRYGDTLTTTSFFTLVLDRTIESACIIDGVRLRGAHGNAGSIAHVTVDPGGPACACGAIGCLGSLASASALEAEMNRPLRRATPSIIERTGIMVGRAIASSAAAFDVSTFVLSGVVVDTFGDAMIDTMRREIAARLRLPHLAGLQVVEPSGFVQPLVGAAALVGTSGSG
ncbi:MAG TPA: ROK family protein [Ilumatobacteraceae bacterium]|nr:ROK family protein [Ilumatobacteraceae bacterium]